MKKLFIILFIVVYLQDFYVLSQKTFNTSVSGQFNGWGLVNFNKNSYQQLGGRFIPEFNFEKEYEKINIDGEVSFNSLGSISYLNWEYLSSYEKFQPFHY